MLRNARSYGKCKFGFLRNYHYFFPEWLNIPTNNAQVIQFLHIIVSINFVTTLHFTFFKVHGNISWWF